ncbi:MAG: hypothetical protein K8H88_09185, partial [Sandaracinaceae bacterium]|nr:hypothetical protein [Sandaracinaceae bacterium]
MTNYLRIGLSSWLLLACGGPMPVPLPDAGARDSGTDAFVEPDAFVPAPEPIAITCTTPGFGAILEVAADTPVEIVASIAEPAIVTEARIGGTAVTPDASGVIRRSVNARFGINHVPVEVAGEGGRAGTALCSFLAAPAYHAAADPLLGAISMRMSPLGIDDGDGGDFTTVESLNDLFRQILEGGLLEETLDTRFASPTVDIKTLSCDRVEFGQCVVETAIDYVTRPDPTMPDLRGATLSGIETSSLV